MVLNVKKVPSHAVHHTVAFLGLTQQRFEWTRIVNDYSWNIGWIDKCSKAFFQSLKSYQKVNHMPGVEQLSRKKFLSSALNELSAVMPRDFDIYPRSWTFPQDYEAFQQAFVAQRAAEAAQAGAYEQAVAAYNKALAAAAAAGGGAAAGTAPVKPTPPPLPQTYIVKPGSACQGRGIFLAQELSAIKRVPGNVVQEVSPCTASSVLFPLR